MVATAARTILESLDRIPNSDQRTKVAIIAFDVALYFFAVGPVSLLAFVLKISNR
jgi:protein transport protein SEC24